MPSLVLGCNFRRCSGDSDGGGFQEGTIQKDVRMGSLRRIRYKTGQKEVARVGWDSFWQPDIAGPSQLLAVSQARLWD